MSSGPDRSSGKAADELRQRILDAAADPIVTLDHRGHVLALNPAAERLLGREVVSQPIEQLIPALPREGLERYLTTGDWASPAELSARRADGTQFPVGLAILGVPFSTPPRFVGFLLDLAPKPQVDRTGEDRFRALVDAAPDAMIVADASGRMIAVNAQTEKLFGYDRSELLGRKVELLIPARSAGGHAAHREAYARKPKLRPMDSGLELRAARKDGSELPVEISLSPLKTDDGQLVVAAIRDLTARKKSEETERQLERERAARALAENAVQVRDDFVATAGHELKTPLAALLMHLQSLQRALRSGPIADLEDRLKKAVRSGLRLDSLVNQLLDVSRIAAGRLLPDPEPFNLVELVREVLDRFAEASPPSVGSPSIRAGAGLELWGRWDRFRVDQALSNVIANAIKYGQGKPVELELSREHGCAIVRVIDQGIGIDPGHRQRIFERFERAVASREFGGFGLGLWITRQIVELSGGKIEVDGTPGRGSTFTIRLPLWAQEPADVPR